MRIQTNIRWLLGVALLVGAGAQTRIDLRTQTKRVDFSGVPTKPFRTGTTLPATCSVGEAFFKVDALAGQNFYGCTATNEWTLQAASPMSNYSVAFTTQTALTIPGTAHGYGTANLLLQCYDTTGAFVEPDSVSINSSTYDVAVAFSSSQSGRCVVNGGALAEGGSSGGGGTSPVASVFGRAGTVIAAAGDYNFSQIAGTVAGAQLPIGIDAGVLRVTLANSTMLTIGEDCSAASPCNVRIGDTVESIQVPSTATITAGTGTAYIYLDEDGVLTVGHNLAVACSGGCSSQQGITAFPNHAIPIASWSASAGTWNQQGTDWRALLSTNVLDAGVGVMTIDSGSRTTIAVDTTVVPTYLSGSATLDFPAIAEGACSSDMVFSLLGASPGDTVAPGWPGTLPSGLFGTMFVSGVNTVSARLCNLSGVTVDPAAATYKATIVRSF